MEKGVVTPRVLQSDGTVVENFNHAQALKAYMSVTKSTRKQGVGNIPAESRFRLAYSREFVEALMEGDAVEMRFKGDIGLVQSEWDEDVHVLDGLAEAVKFLICWES